LFEKNIGIKNKKTENYWYEAPFVFLKETIFYSFEIRTNLLYQFFYNKKDLVKKVEWGLAYGGVILGTIL
jgi:hypothetical protein